MGHLCVAGRSIRAKCVLWALLTGAGLALAGGCGADDAERIRAAELAEGCVLNTDCKSPLVCAFKKCHVQCKDSRDCEADQLCVPSGDKPFNVCLLESEALCIYHSDCPGQLFCAKDQHCRAQCKSNQDCLGEQTCASGACADADETTADGGLPPPPDGGKDSSVGDLCLYNSDCPAPLVCKLGACMPECMKDVDCPLGLSCVLLAGNSDKSCVAPGQDGGTGGTAGTGGTGGIGGTDGGVVIPGCANGQLDPGETEVDCGGGCGVCNGGYCTKPSDCASYVCKSLSCAAPSCSDGLQNGLESDIDCGPGCAKCGAQKGCWTSADCLSGQCKDALCQPAGCSDKLQNGNESDVDCGGTECAPCPAGSACIANSDCGSQNCVAKKCVPAGPTKWVKAFGANGRADVDVDTQGNILVAGEYSAGFDFGAGKLIPSQSDWILAKYTPAGAHLWSRRHGSSGTDDYVFAGFDSAGDVLAYGKMQNAGSFGGTVLSCDSTFVIAKYKGSDGSHVWSRCYDGTNGSASPHAAAVDPSGDLVVSGTFLGAIDFGNGSIFNSSWNRLYVAKYSGVTGDLVWVRVIYSAAAPSAAQEITALKATTTGVYAAGRLRNTVDFGNGVSLGVPLGVYPDVFVIELSSDGTTQKGKAWGSSGDESPTDIELVGSDLLLTGYLVNPIDFGTGTPLTTYGMKDIFLVRLKPDLSAVWAKSFGGGQDDLGASVAALKSGEIALVGSVGSAVSFGGGPVGFMGGSDYFLTKLSGTGAFVSSEAWGGGGGDHGRSVRALATGLVFSATFSSYGSPMIDMGFGTLPAAFGDNIVVAHSP